MPYYNEPAFYIDFSTLPAPEVIETIAYESILASYKARVLAANPDLAAALNLEQSATNIILETEAYGEMILRARVNAAARAVMLAFATGPDLDNLAAFYNVVRLVNADGTSESDARFRFRVQKDAETFSTAGTAGSYIFHAMTADPSILSVSATKINAMGGVQVTLMNTAQNPTPTESQITNVLTYLNQINRKVLTDVVNVTGPKILRGAIDATVTLYPGPDATVVSNNIAAAVKTLIGSISQLGYGLERSAVYAALMQPGVQNVVLNSPTADIDPDITGCVCFTQPPVVAISNNRLT